MPNIDSKGILDLNNNQPNASGVFDVNISEACSLYWINDVYSDPADDFPNFTCTNAQTAIWKQWFSRIDPDPVPYPQNKSQFVTPNYQLGGIYLTGDSAATRIDLYENMVNQLDSKEVGWSSKEFFGYTAFPLWFTTDNLENTPNNVRNFNTRCLHNEKYSGISIQYPQQEPDGFLPFGIGSNATSIYERPLPTYTSNNSTFEDAFLPNGCTGPCRGRWQEKLTEFGSQPSPRAYIGRHGANKCGKQTSAAVECAYETYSKGVTPCPDESEVSFAPLRVRKNTEERNSVFCKCAESSPTGCPRQLPKR